LNLRGTWLVVLSACDTGLGQVRPGEGVLGLRRGFLHAGAQNIMLTLWPIDDRQTSQFIVDFYRKACRSGDAPLAFAEVQRDWLTKLAREKGVLEACRIAGPFILSSQGRPH
jgi:CHAT domain-containing protein